MSEENSNIDESGKDNKTPDQQNEPKFEDFVNKFKDSDNFKTFIEQALSEKHDGLIKNRDSLLNENAELKKHKSKVTEDEVIKLLTSDKEEDKQKAIEKLTGTTTERFQKLLEDKDKEINDLKEKDAQYTAEKEKGIVFEEFKKNKIFEDVRPEAVKDFVLPNVLNNFKVKDGKITYVGTEINKAGKPLNMEEYLVEFFKEKRFLLKEKVGSNLLSKNTEQSSSTSSKSSFEDHLRSKGKIKDIQK